MKERKFITPICMKVTKSQFENDLKNKLSEMGYKIPPTYSSDQFVVTDNTGTRLGNLIHFYKSEGHFEFSRRHNIEEYNPELFLALAAMTDEGRCFSGQYVVMPEKGSWCGMEGVECPRRNELVGSLFRIERVEDGGNYVGYASRSLINGKLYGLSDENCRQANKEELIAHFTKDKFELPKHWSVKAGSPEECKIVNAYARSIGGSHWHDEVNHAKRYHLHVSDGGYVKGSDTDHSNEITFEQFEKYVLNNNKKEMKEESVFPQIISEKDAKKVISIVCGSWSRRLAKKWGEDLILNGEVEVTQKDYDLAIKECDKDQMKIINSIVGIKERTHAISDTYIKEGETNAYVISFIRNGNATGNPMYALISLKDGKAVSKDYGYCKDGNNITEEEFDALANGEGDKYIRRDFDITPR